MDTSANAPVSGGPPAASLPGELAPGEATEGGEDVSLEWLSIFVEDCLSGTTSYTTTSLPLPPSTPSTISHDNTPPSKSPQPQNPPKISSFQDLAIPAKARTKRRRVTTPKALSSQDPLLFHQTCWLADSELILPKKEQEQEDKTPTVDLLEERGDGEAEEKIGKEQQTRRCTHCLSSKTPQWRRGPLGPKTLCNACGVRFKSGRLLPEYRPAKSPTFVSYKHSNSHKKVMEMRMMATLSSQSK